MSPEAQSVEAMLDKALEHHGRGELYEAAQGYQDILALQPAHADSLHLLGMVAYQSGDLEVAAALIRQAIAVHPGGASYSVNLGNVLQAQGALADAEAAYRRALALKAELIEAQVNLAHVLVAQAKVDDSVACYERALRLDPGHAEAATGLALAHLLNGNFAEGWKLYEHRWDTSDHDTPKRHYREPRWDGERLDAGSLLIWGEQGLGDEVMFASLIPKVLQSGNRLVVDCHPRLRELFTRSFPEATVVSGCLPGAHTELQIAAHLPSGSLPGLLGYPVPEPDALPASYLVADEAKRNLLRARYDDSRPLIGLAWYTNNPKTGRDRSIHLSLLRPLAAATNARWVSLQYGEFTEVEEQAASACFPVYVDRAIDQLVDTDLFAAQIAAMDLVITVDNSTAHLAGALGVPVWVLLPFAPNWRWLLHREDSPWYPGMRLFRQTKPGDWASVIEQVKDALSNWRPGSAERR